MKWIKCIAPLVQSRTILGVNGLKWYSQVTRKSLSNPYHTSAPRRELDCVTICTAIYSHSCKISLESPSIVSVRCYAKGKDKKKEKGKHKVVVDEKLLAEIVDLDDIKHHMQKAVDHLKEQYVQTLSIRSQTGAIENLKVSFEGKEYSIQELGQVARKDTKTVIINMVAFPQATPSVLKALQKSGMNLNPQQDGTTLYIPVPRVTTEHREQLSKNAKTLFVQCRDTVKNVHIKHEKKLKNSSIAQDTLFSAQQQLTTLANDYVAMADLLLQTKIKELTGKSS